MPDSNGSSEQSTAHTPDFGRELEKAKASGDFEFIIRTAKDSHKMLVDFRDAIANADFKGHQSTEVAQGLNFIAGMINQAAAQLEAIKRVSKVTTEAIKSGEEKNG